MPSARGARLQFPTECTMMIVISVCQGNAEVRNAADPFAVRLSAAFHCRRQPPSYAAPAPPLAPFSRRQCSIICISANAHNRCAPPAGPTARNRHCCQTPPAAAPIRRPLPKTFCFNKSRGATLAHLLYSRRRRVGVAVSPRCTDTAATAFSQMPVLAESSWTTSR